MPFEFGSQFPEPSANLRPKQSYESYGPIQSLEIDYHYPRFICIEIDHLFCRVDRNHSVQEAHTNVNDKLLADNLVRGVGFKLGAFDKFGA